MTRSIDRLRRDAKALRRAFEAWDTAARQRTAAGAPPAAGVAQGLDHDRPDAEGLPPVQMAGREGLPEAVGYLLTLRPGLAHENGDGGTLLSTIIHGSENCPDRASRDHAERLRLALEQGVALPRQAIAFAGEPGVAVFLADGAEARPGQVVEGGPA